MSRQGSGTWRRRRVGRPAPRCPGERLDRGAGAVRASTDSALHMTMARRPLGSPHLLVLALLAGRAAAHPALPLPHVGPLLLGRSRGLARPGAVPQATLGVGQPPAMLRSLRSRRQGLLIDDRGSQAPPRLLSGPCMEAPSSAGSPAAGGRPAAQQLIFTQCACSPPARVPARQQPSTARAGNLPRSCGMPADAKPAPRRHGRRLRALGDAFHRTVKYALRPVDQEAFAQQFPTLRDALVENLYQAFKQARSRASAAAAAASCRRLCIYLLSHCAWQCLYAHTRVSASGARQASSAPLLCGTHPPSALTCPHASSLLPSRAGGAPDARVCRGRI